MKHRLRKKLVRVRRALRKAASGRVLHGLIFIGCLTIVGISLLLSLDKATGRIMGSRWNWYCFFDDVFGLKNASCGLIRSFSAISRGDIAMAFRYHYIGPVIFGFIVLQIPYRLWALVVSPNQPPGLVVTIYKVLTGLVITVIVLDWFSLLGCRMI